MGQDSKIEWTHHTFNPWRGCTKVSPGCTNCYAETLSHRNPKVLGVWGDKGTRVVASDSMWREPIKWDREAREAGERRRVFCASLADVFEDREELDEPRFRLLRLIASTTNLDWLLLTKRPDRIEPILKRTLGVLLDTKRVRRIARAAVDLGAAVAAAPDEIGLEADDGIAAARLSALHAFQQERIVASLAELQEDGDRRLEIGDQARVDSLPAAGLVE